MSENETRWQGYVAAMCADDREALGRFYDETSSAVFGLALRVLNSRSDAEEVVLDVYRQLWNSRHTYDAARGTVWGWVTSLTRNCAIERLRVVGQRQESAAAGESETPDAESVFQQERALVLEAMQSLTAEQREAIELSFFRGLTHVEVAEALNVPLGTIKTRIRVGMRKLRDTLAPLGSAEGAN